ncbi:two-component system nitrate/nitrite sensor histidine kinase NarX [Acidovorax sp. 107]|uniref:type IV pili methyl-accepting chemotaxis transducer N-terminal domain-containing protein n=1 Tax=Acidovorax sp. 107 TaxID=2135638 RepID=UPI000D39E351|nr:type IV pili methyl-accepting chemotaxis transducer N-terminal domain-containing protein [Acidovorax sp. 107]PUA98560.1 two-component system nitrate/nitrite sensor histidine kinase NarX [Acidovorax sp. 107]
MRSKPSLSAKLLAMGAGFLLVALASIGLTLWVTWKLEGGAAAVNEAGRLRMNMLRMVLVLQTEPPEAVRDRARQFDASLELLRTGDPSRPLAVPWSDETRMRFDGIRARWTEARAGWVSALPPDRAQILVEADAFVQQVDGFVDAIEVQIAGWTAALHLFQLFMMALAIVAAVTFMVMSYLLVINPVARLQQAQVRLRQGELGTRLPVDTDDEFGQLSAGFNLMAHAMQASHDELEHKVREKTASIAVQNQRLAALYEVSALASTASSLELLAQGFVQQIRRVAGADAVAVRWSNEANERYVLLAGDGLPATMAEGEHCLHTGSCLCGQPQAQARTRVIPITPSTDVALPHCRDAGFETMVTIPVKMQLRMLGEVNLFFRSPVEMTDELRDLLEAMTRHLASAMEGLRATALEREAAVAEERSLLARELHDSIAQSLAFLKIQTQLLRDAVARGDVAKRDRSIGELDMGVRECYSDVRELLVHFRTRTSDEDIESALRATLSKFEHQTGMATTLGMVGHGLPLAQDVQIQVLHMVQEALSNVRKHSGSTRVDLLVHRHPRWRFEVQDNGTGFDVTSVPPDSLHVGLGIMRERAQRIGAVVQVESTPGQGTRVCIELPSVAPAQAVAFAKTTAPGAAASPQTAPTP